MLQFGDHRVFLDLGNDRKSVTDLMTAPQIDADLLKGVMVKHDSGVDLLLAPTSPEEADLVTPENFAAGRWRCSGRCTTTSSSTSTSASAT